MRILFLIFGYPTGREGLIAFKLLGSALIIASGIFFSRRLIDRDSIGISRLHSLEELIKAIKSRIENFCMPTDEILADIPPELFLGCGYFAAEPPKSVDELILQNPFSSDGEAGAIFEKFFSSLGTSYKDEELARCRIACEDIDAMIKRRQSEHGKRQKTIPMLNLCISVVAVIIFF